MCDFEVRKCGWVCGLALALFLLGNFMGADLMNWLRLAFFPAMPAPPALAGTETLITVLMAMLGPEFSDLGRPAHRRKTKRRQPRQVGREVGRYLDVL